MSNTVNPKAAFGSAKPGTFAIPRLAIHMLGVVMSLGAYKYGLFNWRESRIASSTYVDAINRHLTQWVDGEDDDPESGVSHLAHIMACCSLVIDSKACDMLDDDRPTPSRGYTEWSDGFKGVPFTKRGEAEPRFTVDEMAAVVDDVVDECESDIYDEIARVTNTNREDAKKILKAAGWTK